ncbi:hypothetical protein OQH61_03755 [Helicobacter sp. MIT 21-1697]|uniref:hypothetical protein n=1 Tax=Helicobacter sp. MIT 21-1697 TaxID=2993733 RepID=UPI00224B1DFD|nr:hypothetical protein [Helicobacter sp. MIT 21-1697]MCX2716850.1 hypothetical protein [Helicobacter sp. MIT 21-1697]
MATKALYEEVIDEIGTQTLARFGLNIFNLPVNFSFCSYEAYGASVRATQDTFKAYNTHKKNDKYFGQTFEEIDIGQQNIKDSLFNGNKTYTTDTLADIKNVREINASGKDIKNLNPKDREKYEHIMAYYADEVKNMDFEKLGNLPTKNHNTTDSVTLDKNGNVVKTAQLKVIKNTEGLLKDRYLEGDAAVDELKMPFDDYKKHKENLEQMIEKGKNNPNDVKVVDKAAKAEKALEKLNANNLCNRFFCENPRTTAVVTQSIVASGHIAQAGFSDALIAALATLANGIIWEIKDMFKGSIGTETSILKRIKRLLQKTIESFQATFGRGAGFGAIDVAVGIVGQIFRSIAGSLRLIWDKIREAAKSIHSGIVSYFKGEVSSLRELLGIILKSLFSAAWVVSTLALEESLKPILMSVAPPLLPFTPIFAIVAGAFAVVVTHRSIDLALDTIFWVFAARDKAKLRAEEIADIVAANLPTLIEKREELEQLIESTHKERLMSLESSFADYQKAYANADDNAIYEGLNRICNLYGSDLNIKDMNDVESVLKNPNRTGQLKW